MNKPNVIFHFIFAFILSFLITTANGKVNPDEKPIQMPENVKEVIQNSCYGCHNNDSRNEDAREELNFDVLNDLSKVKQLGALKHIREVLEENEMPPKKFLERKPDKALTEEQKQLLIDWVKQQSTALMSK